MSRTKSFDREVVLENAMELFWEKGFHGTSMQDLVDHLGINRASLYDTYGDKYNLFLETLSHYRKVQSHRLNNLLNDQKNILHFLEDFLVNTLEDGKCDPKGCYVVNSTIEMAPHDEQINKMVMGNMLSFEQKFQAFFEIAQRSGSIDSQHSPKNLARYLYNTMVGLRVISRTVHDPEVLREIVNTSLMVFKRN